MINGVNMQENKKEISDTTEKKGRLNRKKKLWLIFGGIGFFLLLFLGAFFGYDYYDVHQGKIAQNVYFLGEDLSGLSEKEAREVISEAYDVQIARNIRLYTDSAEWIYTAGDLGLIRDDDNIYNAACEVTRAGNIFQRYQERYRQRQDQVDLTSVFQVDETKIDPILTAIAEEIGTTAQDASFGISDDGSIYINPSVNGSALDVDATKELVSAALSDRTINEVQVVINTNAVPETTTEDLEAMKINGVLATFSTKYNAGQADRSHNLWQACEYLDMTIIEPGATFSFNDTVGQRTAERGFRDAVIIENGQFTPGMGGGVCQVSTTVYGAILRCPQLTVTERNPHSLVIAYVDPGQDAMVAWGSSDLKFRNDYETPVLIHAYCSGGTITVTFYGNTEYKQDVEITSEVVRYIPYTTETVTDESLAPGTQQVKSSGSRGLEANVYRSIISNGQVISTETVSTSTYRAQKRIVLVGPNQ